jgi:hypothetical protein
MRNAIFDVPAYIPGSIAELPHAVEQTLRIAAPEVFAMTIGTILIVDLSGTRISTVFVTSVSLCLAAGCYKKWYK